MLKLTRSIAMSFTAVSAALLLGAAAPSAGGASPIVSGHGNWVIPGGDIVSFQVSVVELPNGAINGHGVSYRRGPNGLSWIHFEVIEYAYFGGEVAVLGVITEVFNTPATIPVGSLTALLVQDNGNGGSAPDRAVSAVGLPTFLTLAQILNTPPPLGPPPPEFWFPLAHGNFQMH